MDDARHPRSTEPRTNPRAPGKGRGRVDEVDDDDDDGVVVVILNKWVSIPLVYRCPPSYCDATTVDFPVSVDG